MRVIAGTYRSRRLIAPRGLATRPTSDRLRETLFNVLAARIEGAVFADLYAGSGAVGIEALSRGASLVYFVDHAAPAIEAIRGNLASLAIRSGFHIECSSVSAALRRLSIMGSQGPRSQGPRSQGPRSQGPRSQGPGSQGPRAQGPCTIVFLDPPYPAAGDYASTLDVLGRQAASLLTAGGIVIAEHSRKMPPPLAESYGPLRRYRVLEQGDAGLSFYSLS
jgi:16S rRNA (guanine966-N2)-methyltransferase